MPASRRRAAARTTRSSSRPAPRREPHRHRLRFAPLRPGQIGAHFPDTDPANRGRDSLEMLRTAVAIVRERGYLVEHVDATVILERPKLAPHRDAMCAALGAALGLEPREVSVKAKTNEGMGW